MILDFLWFSSLSTVISRSIHVSVNSIIHSFLWLCGIPLCVWMCRLPWWLRQQRICLQWKRPRFDPAVGTIPLGKGNDYLLQYSCLRDSIDRGAWQATVHGVTKSWTQLSDNMHTHTHTHIYMCVCVYICVYIYEWTFRLLPCLGYCK